MRNNYIYILEMYGLKKVQANTMHNLNISKKLSLI